MGNFHVTSLHDTFYLVNGQHRYRLLQELDKDILAYVYIVLNICIVDTEQQMNLYFQQVNSSKPVKIYSSVNTQLLTSTIRKRFTEAFRKYISSAKSPHRPNINLDTMMEQIEQKGVLEGLQIQTAEQFMEKVNRLNEFYSDNPLTKWKQWRMPGIEAQLEKCRDRDHSIMHPLYLGLFPSYEWLDRIQYCHAKGVDYGDIPHYPAKYRPKIGKAKRRMVWNKRNPSSMKGCCYVCSRELDYDDFECGHVESVFYGGDSSIGNLEPICKQCNNDMGTDNLEVYKSSEFV